MTSDERPMTMRIIALAILCSFAAVTAAQEMGTQSIYNYRKVDERHATGGQPTEEQLKAAAAEGYETIINLATIDPRYSLKDEGASARRARHEVPPHSGAVGSSQRRRFRRVREGDAVRRRGQDAGALRGELPRDRVLLAVCNEAPRLVARARRGIPRVDLARQRLPGVGRIHPPTSGEGEGE